MKIEREAKALRRVAVIKDFAQAMIEDREPFTTIILIKGHHKIRIHD